MKTSSFSLRVMRRVSNFNDSFFVFIFEEFASLLFEEDVSL